jgi:hypothetical protein
VLCVPSNGSEAYMPTILLSSTEALTSCTQEKAHRMHQLIELREAEKGSGGGMKALTWMCVSLVATTSSIAGQTYDTRKRKGSTRQDVGSMHTRNWKKRIDSPSCGSRP